MSMKNKDLHRIILKIRFSIVWHVNGYYVRLFLFRSLAVASFISIVCFGTKF